MNTFTIGFDLASASGLELSFDERAKIYVAKSKTKHHEKILKAVTWRDVA